MSPPRPPPGSGWRPVTDALAILARRFARTKPGRTGQAKLDVLLDPEEILAEAGVAAGPLRETAIAELAHAETLGLLRLEHHSRDPAIIQRIRLFPEQAPALHALLGLTSPAEQRERLAACFEAAASFPVPADVIENWRAYCLGLADAARAGNSVQPFDRNEPTETREILDNLARLLSWQGESYLRFASCSLCGDSKTLERRAGRLGTALETITSGAIRSLADLGISENPRSVMLHGPIRLELDSHWLDIGLLRGVTRLSAFDIERASRMDSPAPRCISVENDTSLHELAKLASGDILIGTSFLGSGTRRLIDRLPPSLPLWHFGDTDPAGFAILADLRERLVRPVNALHMTWRPAREPVPLSATERKTAQRLLASSWLDQTEKNVLRHQLEYDDKGAFEQETLGPPLLRQFPYYPQPPPASKPPATSTAL